MAATKIDFSTLKFDLKELAESRLLSQFYNSTVLKLLLDAFTSEVQELSDAIYELLKGRSIYNGQGEQLNAIGRIVGQGRTYYDYDTAFWFATDEMEIQPDNGSWWCQNAVQASNEEMDDETYRKWLWMKILENHNKFSSVPELEDAILDGIGETIGIERNGMMTAKIYVSSNISLTNKNLLSYNKDTDLTDNDYMFAYPATTSISTIKEV